MRYLCFTLVALLLTIPSRGQEGLNLPTELFVLLNNGQVERYGLGTEGVQVVTPADQFVIDFSVSPDGGWLAYRTDEALVISEVLTGEGQVLVLAPPLPPSRGLGQTIAWSPDARALAYTTETGLRVHFRIVQPPLTPTTAEVTDSFQAGGFSDLRWSPDGRYLAARNSIESVWQVYTAERATLSGPVTLPPASSVTWMQAGVLAYAPLDGGLRRINFDVGNARSEIAPATRRYDLLTTLPDGQVGAFSRTQTDAIPPGSGRYTVITPATGQTDVRGTADIDLSGLQWTPGGALMVAFRGGVLVLVEPLTGEGFQLPIAQVVAYGWGRPPLPAVDGYPVPANLFFVAQDTNGVNQVWQLFRDSSPPVPLTDAPDDVTGYSIAPDGFGVAYGSGSQVWYKRLNDGSEPVVLAGRNTDQAVSMDFSPDGATLAYTDNDGIYTVPTQGGDPTALLTNVIGGAGSDGDTRRFSHPRYAPNLGVMLLDVTYADTTATGILDLNSGELRELAYGFQNATWMYNGQVLTFAPDTPFTQAGVQVTDINNLNDPEQRLSPDVSVEQAVLIPRRRWEDIRLLLAPDTLSGPTPLRVFDFRDGGGLVPVLEAGFADQPRLSPDGSVIAGYVRSGKDDLGYRVGVLTLIEVASGEQVALAQPRELSQIRWQR